MNYLVDQGQQLRGRQVLAASREKVAWRIYGPLAIAAVGAPALGHGRPARQAHQVGVAARLRILQAAKAVVGARVGVHHSLQKQGSLKILCSQYITFTN